MTDESIQPEIFDDWVVALRHAESSLEHLRSIYPANMMLIEETGHQAIRRALDSVQDGVVQMHRADRFVMGPEAYEQFVLDRDEERGRAAPTRGDKDG